MGIFDGIEKAQVFGSGVWFQEGKYTVIIDTIKSFPSAQKPSVRYFCVESIVDVAERLDARHAVPSHAQGDKVSWLVNMTQASALGNIKGFALALLPGIQEDEITPDEMTKLIADDQPARGLRVKLMVRLVKTKENTDFSKHTWFPVEADDAALDAAAK